MPVGIVEVGDGRGIRERSADMEEYGGIPEAEMSGKRVLHFKGGGGKHAGGDDRKNSEKRNIHIEPPLSCMNFLKFRMLKVIRRMVRMRFHCPRRARNDKEMSTARKTPVLGNRYVLQKQTLLRIIRQSMKKGTLPLPSSLPVDFPASCWISDFSASARQKPALRAA